MKTQSDQDYMRMAYDLAVKGRGKTSPNPMVGAVLVKKGRVVATGWHQRCGGPHAEILALKSAGQAARGATLYVTLEPCYQFGRTPPCVDAVILSGVKRVIIGMKDPNPATRGKSIVKLRRAGIITRVGFLKDELLELNRAFVMAMTQGRPWVTAKIAQTLDGKVATAAGESKWITSPRSRTYATRQRNEFDAIMVGIKTVLADDPGLNASRRGKRLIKVILDSRLRLPVAARIFKKTRPQDIVIATTAKASKVKTEAFKKQGYQVLVDPSRCARPRLSWLLEQLARQEVRSVLIEGGGELIGSALREKQVDRLHLYIAPLLLGDGAALSGIRGVPGRRLKDSVSVNVLSRRDLGADLFVEGDIVYR